MISYIPIGWRCSTTVLCNKLCDIESFPFRGMYSKFEGIIDCFKSGFKNYIPDIKKFILVDGDPQNDNHKKLWTFHEKLKNPKGNPQRIAFKNHFFCWFYYDLRKNEIVQKMLERIEKMYSYLSSTNDRVVFVRSILDQDEIEMFDKFRNCINLLFPNLDWHLVYLHDQHDNFNKSPTHYIHKGEYTFINATTHPIKPDFALETINQLKDFKKLKIDSKDIKIFTSKINQDVFFTL
jgi:hypothetical protein